MNQKGRIDRIALGAGVAVAMSMGVCGVASADLACDPDRLAFSLEQLGRVDRSVRNRSFDDPDAVAKIFRVDTIARPT
ncbi:hypothetical protein [Paludibacterium paludis]|uniref:Uncharacterized protein n=1 Tax=Paludibacterium paludis TaxID=1225769 RepID=A0A918P6J9_9NEIS|nr:hypothetical protein [Paludibacterium paludis]GGY28360.1 hypothetical protein GCM10011289_34510 [Paludibacterium paludis]